MLENEPRVTFTVKEYLQDMDLRHTQKLHDIETRLISLEMQNVADRAVAENKRSNLTKFDKIGGLMVAVVSIVSSVVLSGTHP